MILFFSAIILIVATFAYFRLADRYNIIDKPNERSSHSKITIRGGGIIFALSALLSYFQTGFAFPFFSSGLFLIGLISLVDDIKTVSNSLRIFIHLLSIGLMFFELKMGAYLPLSAILFIIILAIGTINAYNFMDGINGITPLYSLSIVGTLLYIGWPFQGEENVDRTFYYNLLISIGIFSFLNLRKKALCFAGDVGSVSMAFILIFFLSKLMLVTGRVEYILLLGVYGVDSVLTISHRLLKGENIFKAHRSHLYQYLVHKLKWPHVSVSVLYFIIQAIVNLILITIIIPSAYSRVGSVIILMLLGIVYIIFKARLEKVNPQ